MNIKNEPIRVLSLFDGISTLQQSLKELEIPVEKYWASEIETSAIKITMKNHPNTIQLGDVKQVTGEEVNNVTLMCWGSPCTNLTSLRKNRQGLDSEDSGLFFEALRIYKKVKPQWFIMENVASMANKDRDIISKHLGVEPIKICSSTLSPQRRGRYYWTNIPGITIPEDSNLKLESILENGFTEREKSLALLTSNISHTRKGLLRYLNRSIGGVVFHGEAFAKLSKSDKIKKIELLSDVEVKELFRLFTLKEATRLQGLPDDYIEGIISRTAGFHCLGNSFTNPIIKSILSNLI